MRRVEAFEPKHVLMIEHPMEGEFDAAMWGEFRAAGPALTIMADGRVVACLGVQVLGGRIGECWAVFSPEASGHILYITKVIMRHLARAVRDFNLQRLQAFARVDLETAWRYLEVLGFEREGCLRKFGRDGSDQYIYSMVRD